MVQNQKTVQQLSRALHGFHSCKKQTLTLPETNIDHILGLGDGYIAGWWWLAASGNLVNNCYPP